MSTNHILIVDDEPRVAFFFQKNLEMMGEDYHVKAVNSGNDALAEIRAASYDLMITDLRMPGMNGLELVRQVRQISPQTQTILVTAFGTNDVWQEASQLKVFRSLSKPLKIAELIASVRDALKKSDSLPNADVVVMSGESFEVIAKRLETLRMDVGAHAIVLADTTGHVFVENGMMPKMELSSTLALLGGTMAASGALTEHLHYPQTVHLTYYEGPPYDLYTVSLGKNFFLTIIFDRHQPTSNASRIGIVWLYTRRMLDELLDLLGKGSSEKASVAQDFAISLQGELDSMFGEAPIVEAPKRPLPSVHHSTDDIHGKVESLLLQFKTHAKLDLTMTLEGLDVPLNQMQGALVLKLLREGLKNVLRYAKATAVTVVFESDGRVLNGRIQDNGQGFDAQNTTFKSLAQLQTELGAFGGKLTVNSKPREGAQLTFVMPIKH